MNFSIRHWSLAQLSLFCAAAALALFSFTLAPTFGWGDSADLAMRMVVESDKTFTGSHRDYVLYRHVGTLFQLLPLGDAGTRANFMSAFFGAVSVGLVVCLSGLITRSNLGALGAGLALMVSHSFWLMSVLAEVYSFNAALVLTAFILATLWWQRGDVRYLYGAALFVGLSLAHHATGLVLAAAFIPLVVMRWQQLGLARAGIAGAIAVLTSLPYWHHALALVDAGHTLPVAFGLSAPANSFFAKAPLKEFLKLLAYIVYNFCGVAVVLAALGGAQAVRHRSYELLPPALWALAFVYAGVTSSIPDKFNIYVLLYPIVSLLVGVGIAALEPRYFVRALPAGILLAALLLVPPAGYRVAVMISNVFSVDLVGARVIPYRDNNDYFLWPGKRGDWGPRRYAAEALETLPKGATLIADYTLWRPIYALQAVELQRPDVTLVWSEPLNWSGGSIHRFIEQQPCRTAVYLAANTPPAYYELEKLSKHYRIEPKGIVYRVERPRCEGG